MSWQRSGTAAMLGGVTTGRIPARLLQLRKERALSQEEAAHLMGVTVRAWQRWERGESVPYQRNLARVHEVFGVPVEDFYDPTDAQFEGAAERLERIESSLERIEALLTGATEQDALAGVRAVAAQIGRLSRTSDDAAHAGQPGDLPAKTATQGRVRTPRRSAPKRP